MAMTKRQRRQRDNQGKVSYSRGLKVKGVALGGNDGVTELIFKELQKVAEMAIFDVTVLSEENKEIYHEKVFAMDEDTAMDQVLDELDKKGVPYGICMAEEMGQ